MDTDHLSEIGHHDAGALPRRFWYIAAPASRLADKPLAARVHDQQLVLFRDGEGRARALLDRCCHRGVALSLGKLESGTLACGYHGWRYDGDGRCVHIPSLPEGRAVPKGCEVKSYPCVEQDGYVWVWIDGGEPAPALPPPVADFAKTGWTQGTVALACTALAGIENNVDWCHPVFAHPFTHGQFFANQAMGFREQQYEVRRTASGLTVFAPPTASPDDPIGFVFVRLTFDLPNRVTVSFGVGASATAIVMHFVPTGDGTCRQEWLTSKPESGLAWSDEEPILFRQDRLLIESAERWRGSFQERSVEADVSTLLVRRIVALAAAGRWDSEREKLPARRVVTVRA
ncbi:MAG TPA: Rieske 2Fe-2S domain-containing protein [Rhizomicrobium sp.]|jgi:nitrite reductase/ring-hydroxylating ferredoxin subunit|nr:Rieske 2Fe-2S domain-containing protein [Rhizomicrobium sp.]